MLSRKHRLLHETITISQFTQSFSMTVGCLQADSSMGSEHMNNLNTYTNTFLKI